MRRSCHSHRDRHPFVLKHRTEPPRPSLQQRALPEPPRSSSIVTRTGSTKRQLHKRDAQTWLSLCVVVVVMVMVMVMVMVVVVVELSEELTLAKSCFVNFFDKVCFLFTSNGNSHFSSEKTVRPQNWLFIFFKKVSFRKKTWKSSRISSKNYYNNNNGKPWKSSRILRVKPKPWKYFRICYFQKSCFFTLQKFFQLSLFHFSCFHVFFFFFEIFNFYCAMFFHVFSNIFLFFVRTQKTEKEVVEKFPF